MQIFFKVLEGVVRNTALTEMSTVYKTLKIR